MGNLIQEEEVAMGPFMFIREDKPNDKLVKLTRENVAKAEAMFRSDSAYFRGTNAKFIPRLFQKGKRSGKLAYVGSTAFWMMLLKTASNAGCEIDSGKVDSNKDGRTYSLREILAGAIASVDNENSTHLNANGVGRVRAWKAICEYIKKNGIKTALNNLKDRNDLSLYNEIAKIDPEPPSLKVRKETNESTGRLFIDNEWLFDAIKTSEKNTTLKKHGSDSFASKFCHYACFYAFEGTEWQDNYSIFDNVLKKVLPKYLKKFKIKNGTRNYTQKDLENYETYRNAIEDLRKKAPEKISRNGLDHLLWYFHKGRLDDKSYKD